MYLGYSVGVSTQLRLPLGQLRQALEALEPEPGPATPLDGFEQLYAELEGLLLRFQDTMPYGPRFTETWHKARAATCQAHGWTVDGFYAELSKRLAAKRS